MQFKRVARVATLTLMLFSVVGIGALQAGVRFDKKGPAIKVNDDRDWFSHKCDDKYYTENWTTMLRSDQGHILYVTFLKSNIGVMSGSSIVSASISYPGKPAEKSVFREFQHSLGDFKEQKTRGRISIKKHYLTLTDRRKLKLHVEEGDLTIDVDITSFMDGVRFHSGKFFLDKGHEKWVQTFVHVPWGKFEGTMKLGKQTVKFKGDAFVDHLRQNVLGTDYATHWWSARMFSDNYAIAFFNFKSPKSLGSKRIHRILVMNKEEVLAQSNVLQFSADKPVNDPEGHRYATRYKFSFMGEKVSVKGTFVGKRLHNRDAMLERMNAVQRGVVKMMAGEPINYRQDGTASVTIQEEGKEPVQIKAPVSMESLVLIGE